MSHPSIYSQSHTHSHTHSLTHSLTHPPTHSPIHSLTHPSTHSLTHSPIHSLTHPLTHTPTRSLHNVSPLSDVLIPSSSSSKTDQLLSVLPDQLYTLLTEQRDHTLVLDCRKRADYTSSHVDSKKYPMWLSIAEEAVQKGLILSTHAHSSPQVSRCFHMSSLVPRPQGSLWGAKCIIDPEGSVRTA